MFGPNVDSEAFSLYLRGGDQVRLGAFNISLTKRHAAQDQMALMKAVILGLEFRNLRQTGFGPTRRLRQLARLDGHPAVFGRR